MILYDKLYDKLYLYIFKWVVSFGSVSPSSGVFHLGSKGWIRKIVRHLRIFSEKKKKNEVQDINHGKTMSPTHLKWVCHVWKSATNYDYPILPSTVSFVSFHHQFPHGLTLKLREFLVPDTRVKSPKRDDLEPVSICPSRGAGISPPHR